MLTSSLRLVGLTMPALLRTQYDQLLEAHGASDDRTRATTRRLIELYASWEHLTEAERYRAGLDEGGAS